MMTMTEKRSVLFFRLLANKFFPGKPEQMGTVLPKEEFEEVMACKSSSQEPQALLFRALKQLDALHPSWITPSLERFPESLRDAISQNLFGSAPAYPDPVRAFLAAYLYEHIGEKEPTPKELMPPTDMSELVECRPAELAECISLLSLFDMVEEMRQIVDKRLLQRILLLLTKDEQQYLKRLLPYRPKLASPSMNLISLSRDPKQFQKTRTKRGLERLALALSGQASDFIWHISHALEKDMAAFLTDHIAPQPQENATHLAQQQVVQTLQTIISKRAT